MIQTFAAPTLLQSAVKWVPAVGTTLLVTAPWLDPARVIAVDDRFDHVFRCRETHFADMHDPTRYIITPAWRQTR